MQTGSEYINKDVSPDSPNYKGVIIETFFSTDNNFQYKVAKVQYRDYYENIIINKTERKFGGFN